MEQLILFATVFAETVAGFIAIIGMIAIGALVLIYVGNFGWLVIEIAITACRYVKEKFSHTD